MTPTNKIIAVFYPDQEDKVSNYYDKIYKHLEGAMGTKYDVDSTQLSTIQVHNTAIPQAGDILPFRIGAATLGFSCKA